MGCVPLPDRTGKVRQRGACGTHSNGGEPHAGRGKTPNYRTVKLRWDNACAAAGVADAHLHDLRAVAATWAKKQGKDPTALLGHTSLAQTARYLRDREEVVAAPLSAI